MKISNKILLILFIFITTSCSYIYHNHRMKTTTKEIELKFDSNNGFIVYENNNSVIFLDKEKALKVITERLKQKKLCQQRKIKYNKLLSIVKDSQGRNLFYFEKAIDYEVISKDIPNINSTSGYAPLDFYSRSMKKDIVNEYEKPYGYKPYFTDTVNSIKINNMYDWLVYDLLLKGKGKVYNKQSEKYETKLIYEIFTTGDGHGGESLLFENKNLFFIVDVYSDNILPDYECMETIEPLIVR